MCEQLAQSRYVKRSGRDSNLRPLGCKSDALTTIQPPRHIILKAKAKDTVLKYKTKANVITFKAKYKYKYKWEFVERGLQIVQGR